VPAAARPRLLPRPPLLLLPPPLLRTLLLRLLLIRPLPRARLPMQLPVQRQLRSRNKLRR
jgi:hypothetical protein